jgi:hypothetical protein
MGPVIITIILGEQTMKSIGEDLFQLRRTGDACPLPALKRVNAKGLNLKENWFRDAIFAEPELVIGPCRMAGRVDADEIWLPWRTEIGFGSGPIDVLLVSSYGRIGIVETKLSYNPKKRREVVAQVLDYALSLQDADREALPELPDSPHAPLEEDLVECLNAGRFLLVIAGDALDPRALRLSQSMLARHLTSEWDLAMVDLNVYRAPDNEDLLFVVPELLGTVQSDLRQVVRVVVEGESPKARVIVDKIVNDEGPESRGSRLKSVDEFLSVVQRNVPAQTETARAIVDRMQQLVAANKAGLTFELRQGSANLYYPSSLGPRRFLSLRTDGRLRIVLAYLRIAGMEDVIDKLVDAAPPTFTLHRDDRAGGLRFKPQNEDEIFRLLARIETALAQ